MIAVRFEVGTIKLVTGNGWTWEPAERPADEEDRWALGTMAKAASNLSIGYSYSPADGQPGYALAAKVAEELGGKAILPPVTPGEKGVVY